MVQQTLSLFDTAFIETFIEEVTEEEVSEEEVTEEWNLEQYTAPTLLEETQQLFHSDGSEAELVALIQKAIDAIDELCNQTN